MDDDQPRAPTYGPPITIPSPEFLGRVAYHIWFEVTCPAHPSTGASRAQDVAPSRPEGRRANPVATERSHALGNYLPPRRWPAQRRDLYTFYICCRWD